MTEDHHPIDIKRILVSLDCSAHSFAALQAAIQLAKHFDAELQGLFIEDLAVLNLAQMPFRQEIGAFSATVREISVNGMRQSILIQSRRVVRTFRKLTQEEEVRGEISIVRGTVYKTINQASREADLLIIGKSGTNDLLRRRYGSTARALIQNVKKSLLLLENGNILGYPVIVLYDKSPQGKISLETAQALLSEGDTLVVLLSRDDDSIYEQESTYIKEWAADHRIIVTFQTYKKGRLEHVLRLLQGLRTGLLILPNLKQQPERKLIRTLLDRVDMPVMLISSAAED